jgi:hypothetical protein
MSALVRLPASDFPALANMSAGQAVKLAVIGRVGSTTLDGETKMVELVVSSIDTQRTARMSTQAALLASIDAKTSKLVSNAEQVNTPRP